MTHDDIVKQAAERIMQRVSDTWPRTLNIDVLTDDIGRAVREATMATAMHPLLMAAPRPINPYVVEQHLKDYYGKPE